jgi:hypothetical protein
MLSWDIHGGYPCKNGDVHGEGIHYRSIRNGYPCTIVQVKMYGGRGYVG